MNALMDLFKRIVEAEAKSWIREQYRDTETKVDTEVEGREVLVKLQHEEFTISFALTMYTSYKDRMAMLHMAYKKLHVKNGRLHITIKIEND